MKVYKLDEYSHEITLLDIKDDIETYYKLLQCDCIDVATFSCRESDFRIVAIVDDVGAYNRLPVCTYDVGIGYLYGTAIFARHYYNSSEFSDIEPEDLKIIQRCMI